MNRICASAKALSYDAVHSLKHCFEGPLMVIYSTAGSIILSGFIAEKTGSDSLALGASIIAIIAINSLNFYRTVGECTICLERINPYQRRISHVVTDEVQHRFHANCLNAWVEVRHAECPTCRVDMRFARMSFC